VDAHEWRLGANAAAHQGYGVFLGIAALDTENIEWAETRWKLGSRNDTNAATRPLARASALSSCFAWHGEPRIIAGACNAAALYIGTAIG